MQIYQKLSKLSIFLPQTSSLLNVIIEETVKQIDVINPLGVVVATVAGQSSISVAHVASGFYILRVTTVDGNALIKTFIKK